MKIATKISLSFLIIVTLLTSVITVVFYTVFKKNLTEEITTRLAVTARSRQKHIETYLKMLESSASELSKSTILEAFTRINEDDPNWKATYNLTMTRLKRTKDTNPSIYEFMLLDSFGKVVASSNAASVGDEKAADLYLKGDIPGIYLRDAYYSERMSMPLIGVSAVVTDSATGESCGVLAAKIKLDELNKITTDPTGMGKTGEIYLVNKDGYMITPSRFKKDTFLKQKVDTDNFRLCAKSDTREGEHAPPVIARNYMGQMTLGTRDPIPLMKWVLLTEINTSEVFAPLQIVLRICMIVLLLTPIAAWFIGTAVAKAITRPIDLLQKGIEVIGTGNFDHKVGTGSKDEIGQLSRVFDTMTEDLKSKVTSIDRLNEEIRERKKVEDDLQVTYNKLKNTQNDLIGAEKEAALGRFSVGISHEIKNPLGMILGSAEYLEFKLAQSGDDVKANVETIKKSALRANNILEGILQYIRPTALKKENISINELVKEVIPLFRIQSPADKADISTELGADSIRVSVDRNQLHQVIFNILKNAAEASGPGGKVTIMTSTDGVSGVINVMDKGRGIPKSNLSRMFEPFFTTKRSDKPAGLGLITSKAIIDNHKGTISIDSEEGEGTSVRIALPLAQI